MKNLKSYLNVFQLQEYDSKRFAKWVKHNPNPWPLQGKKPLVWTGKARFLYLWSVGLFPITLFFPWFSLILGRWLLLPVEEIRLGQLKTNTRRKIDYLKKKHGLKVIGVSGSYGKTSMKEIIFTILSGKFKVYRTPESYNTVKGIAKAVELELDERYEIFVCEMGEYKPGDVREVCEMVDPDMGIITGVNQQHGERMGGLLAAVRTVFELGDWVVNKGGKVWVNVGNALIREQVTGKEYYERYGEKKYETPLQQNAEGAVGVARYLGMSEREVQERMKLIKPFRHRLQVKKSGNITIIDDAYNSNPDGFLAAISYLESFPRPHIVVTPGIIELGDDTADIHKNLGRKMNGIVDELILVGRNERTENLEEGFGKEVKYVEKLPEWRGVVDANKGSVLFENDLTDEY